LENAMQGVLGMMRFGNHDSPILLEVLGDLLLHRGYLEDAKRLAARAYLKASYEVKDDATREAYREKARQSLSMQTVNKFTTNGLSLEALEQEFVDELAQAERWFEVLADDETKWIDEGGNVDEAFAKKYYKEPEFASPTKAWLWAFVVGGAALILFGFVRIIRRSHAAQGPIADRR